MKLYGYFRSSAAFRVRIALNLKKLSYESAFIHLRRGDQRQPDFRGVNPQGLVPALEVDGAVFVQSLPIIEYLDERRNLILACSRWSESRRFPPPGGQAASRRTHGKLRRAARLTCVFLRSGDQPHYPQQQHRNHPQRDRGPAVAARFRRTDFTQGNAHLHPELAYFADDLQHALKFF